MSWTLIEGKRIRDEFICPITLELFREPIVASDGNTYEKSALFKWLSSNNTSPKTREFMEPTMVPNSNLKKLISDIIAEGGLNLYYQDPESTRIFSIRPFMSLILQCLGPSESTWNLQSHHVCKSGCIGGRKLLSSYDCNFDNVMTFSDVTVSRRHFEITYSHSSSTYLLRDTGSSGGTFLKLYFGKRYDVSEGQTYLIGKHQFKVISISNRSDINNFDGNPICKFQFVAPELSPLLGKYFEADGKGIVIGRELFGRNLPREEKGNSTDSAISSKHASIQYDNILNKFYIFDGLTKPSTNGTWQRLSDPNCVSELFPITEGTEILFGSVRFQASLCWTIEERDGEVDEV